MNTVNTATPAKTNDTVRKLVFAGVFAAITYVVFTFLSIRIPTPGSGQVSVHLGNAFVVLGALLLGSWYGGIGGALVAIAGIAGLLRRMLALVWRHATEDVRSRMPKWAREDTREERASRALAKVVHDDAASSGLLVRTLREHRRTAGGDNASA